MVKYVVSILLVMNSLHAMENAIDVTSAKSKNSTRATIEACCIAGSCYNDQGACCFVQRIALELQKIKLQLTSDAQEDKREKNQKNIKTDFKQLFVVIED